MYRVYASDQRARLNLGIRRRLAPLLLNNRRKIELINILLFSLPGTPILYYGDEIGMGDNIFLGDRNGVRTPMQWSADRNAGFSQANPQQLYLPITIDPEYHYESVNVDNQEKNHSSLLWWMRRVIAMRKKYRAFGHGSIEFLYPDNAKVLAFLRRHADETILVIVNLSRYSQVIELDLAAHAGATPVEVFSQNRFPLIKDTPYLFTLGPYGHFWLSLETQSPGGALIEKRELAVLSGAPVLKSVLNPAGRTELERSVLPVYLQGSRWFGGKNRPIRTLRITEVLPLDEEGGEARLVFIEVTYVEGNAETYVLPMQIATGERAHAIAQDSPHAVIACFPGEVEETILFDAIFDAAFRAGLLRAITRHRGGRPHPGGLVGSTTKALREFAETSDATASTVLRAEQSNTAVIYGGEYFLKLYRRLDEGVNPDVELTRFLTERQAFPHVAPYAGALEVTKPGAESRVIGLAQGLVQNQGDAWVLTLDFVGRFFERVLTEQLVLRPVILPKTAAIDEPLNFPPDLLHLIGGVFPERARLLGQRTAEMHLALAADDRDAAFAPEAFTTLYQRSVYQSMRNGLRRTFVALARQAKHLPDLVRGEVDAILPREKEILDACARLMDRKILAEKIRIHGDYHLGQVLFTGRDFVIIDFEGEPARPLGERRLKRSPLRDVAGMLRSFHYAAYTALSQQLAVRGSDIPTVSPWADHWYEYVSRIFLQAYLTTADGAGFVPADRRDFEVLLESFLLEKAVYEVGYELNNRPDWLGIPLRGIRQLLERGTE